MGNLLFTCKISSALPRDVTEPREGHASHAQGLAVLKGRGFHTMSVPGSGNFGGRLRILLAVLREAPGCLQADASVENGA